MRGVPVGEGQRGGEEARVAVAEQHGHVAQGAPLPRLPLVHRVTDHRDVRRALLVLAEEQAERVQVAPVRRPQVQRDVAACLHHLGAAADQLEHARGPVAQQPGQQVRVLAELGGAVEGPAREGQIEQSFAGTAHAFHPRRRLGHTVSG